MKPLLFFRTIKHLRVTQVIAKVKFHFRNVKVGEVKSPPICPAPGQWVEHVPRRAAASGENRFRLLNQEIDIGKEGWNAPDRDKLLLYHLHYMDILNTSNFQRNSKLGVELIDRWISDNAPCIGNGWEPYPLSLRIVNWIKWHIDGNDLSERAVESLFLQCRGLAQQVEYHLLANHLLANAKALFFAGLFFDNDEAETWKKLGSKILVQELEEQFLPDGGHFELSPMYQAIMVEDLLDVINISRAYDDRSVSQAEEKAASAIRWLHALTHPDGQPAYFNDSTQEIAASLHDLQAYAERLDIANQSDESDGLKYLSTSGYARFQSEVAVVIMDVGEIGAYYQPGHAHCDLLSVEMSLGSHRFLVNTGISTYNANRRRHIERSTASHNTVSIEGKEQSEIWSAFRVGQRAHPFDVKCGSAFVEAAHDGFRDIGLTHRRRIEFKGKTLRIDDSLDPATSDVGTAHFHFHPEFEPNIVGQSVEVGGVAMTFENLTKIECLEYEFCAAFNKRLQAKKIAVTFTSSLSTIIDYENFIYF